MRTTGNIDINNIDTSIRDNYVTSKIRMKGDNTSCDITGESQQAAGAITSEEAREILRTMPLSDNFMFSEVMRDPEICRRVLETILNVPIRSVNVPRTEDSIKILPDSKGIRMDVHVDDNKGTVYDVEMQTGHKSELPKRMRYYQGNIDLDLICQGEPYGNLRKSFVIFICTFDPFSAGRHIYSFENLCLEDPSLHLHDESVKILLNTRGTMNDIDGELREFLTYVENTTDEFVGQSRSHLVRDVHQRVRWIRTDRRTEVKYMSVYLHDLDVRNQALAEGLKQGRAEGLEQGRAEGHAKGFEQGREEGHAKGLEQGREEGHAKGLEQGREEGELAEALTIASSMLAHGLTEDMIAQCTRLSLEDIRDLKNSI